MVTALADNDMRIERLRARSMPQVNASAVYYGPYIGEFAFEIMGAAVNRRDVALRSGWRVTVCSRPDREALHSDYCTKFIGHDIDCPGDCTNARPMPPPSEIERWLPQDGGRVVRPRDYGDRRWPGKYIVYGKSSPEWAGAVVIHARNRPYCEWRNWPVAKWHRFARFMAHRFAGRRLVCIGTKAQALGVERCADLRGADLQVQMDILHTAGATGGFCLGESSGAMHLAEHCGCPVLVWCGGDDGEMERTARWYREAWNPHGVLAHAHRWGDWQPPLDAVKAWVGDFAKERGL